MILVIKDYFTKSVVIQPTQQELTTPGVEIKVELLSAAPPVTCGVDHRPAVALQEAYKKAFGKETALIRVGGTIPVRFPSQDDPGDAGWHIEASFEKNGDWWVNYRSRQRGLLALYLFSDVDTDSAPTRVRPGSHRDAARVLAPAGDEGVPFPQAALLAAQASAARPTMLATGTISSPWRDTAPCDVARLARLTNEV